VNAKRSCSEDMQKRKYGKGQLIKRVFLNKWRDHFIFFLSFFNLHFSSFVILFFFFPPFDPLESCVAHICLAKFWKNRFEA
jgi:hypothetical protein